MKLTTEKIEYLASLSELNLSQSQQQSFAVDLGDILEMMNPLQNAKVGKEPVYNRSHKISSLREDVVLPSLSQTELLQNAPKTRKGAFSVPLVVE